VIGEVWGMDKKAVVKKISTSGGFVALNRWLRDEHSGTRAVEAILEAAGYFEIVEAANEVKKTFVNFQVAHEPDREAYRFQYLEKAIYELTDKLKRAGVV
jgi:hypothetical protein